MHSWSSSTGHPNHHEYSRAPCNRNSKCKRLPSSGGEPPCLDAADTSDDGIVDLSDAVLSFNNLFLGGPPPLPPHPGYGVDPTEDSLSCESSQQP